MKSSEVKKKDLNDDNSSKEVEEVDPEKDMEEEMLSSERIADFQMPEYDAEIGVGKKAYYFFTCIRSRTALVPNSGEIFWSTSKNSINGF